MNVTIFQSIKDANSGFVKPVQLALDRIKSGKSKDTVNAIRKIYSEAPSPKEAKELAKALKMSLPSVCYSGEFSTRSAKGLKKHSGLICLDFDGYPDAETLAADRAKIEANDYTFACFTSPSGTGLKVLVKIPAEANNHKEYFFALKNMFNSEYFDAVTQDVARVCFESYDETLYQNNDSLLWDTMVEKQLEDLIVDRPIIPLKSTTGIIERLRVWGERNFPLVEGQKNANCYKWAAAFSDFGVPIEDCFHVLLSPAIFNDLKLAEETIKRAYTTHSNSFGTKQFEDTVKIQSVSQMVKYGRTKTEISNKIGVSEDDVDSVVEATQSGVATTEFWKPTKQNGVLLSPTSFINFLTENNVFKYYPADGKNFIFIKVNENRVTDIAPAQIKDFTLDYIEGNGYGTKVFDHIAGTTKYFKEDFLSMINTATISMKQDTKDECYLYFDNGVTRITKDSVEKIDYIDLGGFVWDSHILSRSFNYLDDKPGMFEEFIKLVSGGDEERFLSLITTIGYLVHSYKNSSNNRAVIFNDEEITENPNGGTGKGLICQAISKVKNMGILDGKQFDKNKSFAYQTVNPETQVLVFDDVKKNFDFEGLFSLITEGITIEKKNKDAIKIPVEHSPKIVITTNYTIRGTGGSFERRKHEVELAKYFGASKTPESVFGCEFFKDWSTDEWSRFDTFMVKCVQSYLELGLEQANSANLHLRKMITETSHEFYVWAHLDGNIAPGTEFNVAQKFDEFATEYPDFKRLSAPNRLFRKFVNYYATFRKVDITEIDRQGQKLMQFGEVTQATETTF